MDYGWKKGIVSLALTVIVRQILVAVGLGDIADGIALLIGLVMIIIFAVRDKSEATTNMSSIFGDRVRNIRKNIVWIAIMGGIYGLACNMRLLMEGPQSLVALADGNVTSAVSIAFARALSFIPLKALTSLTTGTFANRRIWIYSGCRCSCAKCVSCNYSWSNRNVSGSAFFIIGLQNCLIKCQVLKICR